METEHLIDGIFRGEDGAQREFVRQYSDRLVARAKRVLKGLPAYASGTEVANLVMGNFLMQAGLGREQSNSIVDINDRKDLDSFLFRAVMNRALNEKKKLLRQKRHPTQIVTDEDLIQSNAFKEQFSDSAFELATGFYLQGTAKNSLSNEEHSLLKKIDSWLTDHRQRPGRLLAIDESIDCIHEINWVCDWLQSSDEPIVGMILNQALDMLDDETRKIVTMRIGENRTWETIAQAIGCSVPTVRHRMEDAIATWRREFDE